MALSHHIRVLNTHEGIISISKSNSVPLKCRKWNGHLCSFDSVADYKCVGTLLSFYYSFFRISYLSQVTPRIFGLLCLEGKWKDPVWIDSWALGALSHRRFFVWSLKTIWPKIISMVHLIKHTYCTSLFRFSIISISCWLWLNASTL